ncbi:MAG: arginine--tRNA ligase [Kiritimatiellae bacterium]|nr:arginine--tRNA ligase [Kiritimatiellia bacterium]
MDTIENTTARTGDGDLAAWLQNALEKAFGEAAAGTTLRVNPATDPRFGDFQCNDAMGLAKKLHLPPRAIAQKIVDALDKDNAPATVEIAGPGFINLTVRPEWLEAALASCGTLPDVGKGRKVVIDYSSPNVAKPMHIGHIRSTVIGNALHRLFMAVGYDVVADNHIGDWGTQFGIIIKGYREFLDKEALAKDPVEELQRIYVESYARAKADESWMDACRQETVKLQQGDPDNRALWQEFIRLSQGEFDRVYRRLDVKFDTTRGESYYQDQLAGVVESLEKAGLAKESDGAMIVDLTDDGLDVAIVRKRDGGFNYTTTDIATVATRMRDYNPVRMVYVTDERQQLHFKQFFHICRKMGLVPDTCALSHVWFGLMRLPEGVISTRQGNLIKLETLLDEAESRAKAILDASGKEMTEEQKKSLAADIGVGAIKYADLSHDPQNMIVFTWDRALALEGNSGPYLQYAHARICSLLDKYREAVPGVDPEKAPIVLTDPLEKQLALHLLRYPEAVVRAAEVCKPNVLADYLFALSQLYSSFYQRFNILKSEPAVRDSRAHLCVLVARLLREGLGLLGIRSPERI